MPVRSSSRRAKSARATLSTVEDRTTAYARDAVDGRIVVGELVKAAAERHLRDIVDGPARGIHWRPEVKADRVMAFFPAMLTITAGAKAGQPFHLLDWHTFCVGSLFGWLNSDGRLRFRRSWFETGKGQAKSPLMGGIGLYMMGWYGVPRAAVFSIGQDKSTANVLFQDTVAMCRANQPGAEEGEDYSLVSRGKVVIRGEGDNAWRIEHPGTGSKFQALANGAAISGPRPICVAADEIHEFKTNHSIEVQQAAIAKMPGDAIMMLGTNTPASNQIVGTEYSEFFQAVATGRMQDDEAFAFIARVDKADRETVFDNPACWPKSLPALGITFPAKNVEGEVKTARLLTSKAMTVKRLYFGIPLGAIEFWIAEEAWAAVQGKLDLPALKQCRCWLALDLSQKNDLTALTAVWIDANGHLWAKTWYWTTENGLPDRAKSDNAPYEQWVLDGHLTAVPGPTIDKTFVAAEVKRLCAEYDVQFLAFDPAGIGDFMRACDDIGFPVWIWEGASTPAGRGLRIVSHGQGLRVAFYKDLDDERKPIERPCMPRSVERLEDRILEKTITIENSPVTYMCAGNAAVISDGQKNRAFDKKRSRGRIDGLVTIAMAVGVAASPEKAPKKSFWQR
jgi:phage terminase large subunit-like protein